MRFILLSAAFTLMSLLQATVYAAQPDGAGMMGDGQMMGGWMMAACMLLGLLGLVALVFGIFALVKHLRRGRSDKR